MEPTHSKTDKGQLECVQRGAGRFVNNEYSITPGNVTKILNDLKWPTLEKRRKVAMMFKVISGLSAIQFSP